MSTTALEGTAPDLIEPMVGWRSWRLLRSRSRGEARLASVYHEVVWPVGRQLTAACGRHELQWRPPWLRANGHTAPAEGCTCGIYAATSVQAALPYLDVYAWTGPRGWGSVLGLVQLWGTVVLCDRGWRASRAYPLRLFVVSPTPDERLRHAAHELEAYGVPVELLATTPLGVVAELEARDLLLETT